MSLFCRHRRIGWPRGRIDGEKTVQCFDCFRHIPYSWEQMRTVTPKREQARPENVETRARWGQHKLVLFLRDSPEWKIWNDHNNKAMTQQQFAEFLEQHSIDISAPAAPAHMMEIARDLNASTEAEFSAGLRNQDGQVRFRYTETVKASVGSGQLAVPEKFTLDIPVFFGGADIALSALFRFRVKEGKLSLWYTLVRPEEAKHNAFLKARDEIAEALSRDIINGSVGV